MIKSSKTFVMSEETPNMFGWNLSTDGIDLEDFTVNPVMLYNHDYTKLIGQWTDVRKENTQLLGVPMFDEEDPEAMLYYSKVQQGMLKACSVGITPVKFDEINNNMAQSRLKECSLTPVGANRKAVTVYDDNGKKLSANGVKEFCLSLQPVSKENQNQKMNEKSIAALVVLCAQAGLPINLSATSKDDELAAAIAKVGEKITSLSATNVDLTGKIKKIDDDAKAAEVTAHADLLKKAVDDKLLSAEQAATPEIKGLPLGSLKVVLSAMKPAVESVIEQPKDKDAKTPAENNDKPKWTYDDFALKAPQELEEMQVKDSKKFEALLSAKIQSAKENHSINI